MTELKPCPFCGGEYTQVRYIGGEWQEPSAFVSGYRGECCSCYAITAAYGTEADAVVAWNTRHVETCKRVDVGGYSFRFECSACGYVAIAHNCDTRLDELPNYCPNCGRRVEL